MIVLKEVSKQFGAVKAVNNVSFTVQEGETLILLGTSGCGKTTTLRMINRLIEPSAGEIFVNNRAIAGLPPETLRRGMGYVLQNTGLFPHYTIAENIAVVPKLLHWSPEKIQSRTRELLQKLRLAPEQLALYPDQLSGGQQQRVGLARALVANPPILLMDEPFGALDPITRATIRREFKELDELKNKTIVMVTHDVAEAFALGDRICLMDEGKIQQLGTPAKLLLQPANPFVQSFLQEQRLSLELKTLPVSAVDDFAGRDFPPGTSLWDALSRSLAAPSQEQPPLPAAAAPPAKPTSALDQLLLALQNARKN